MQVQISAVTEQKNQLSQVYRLSESQPCPQCVPQFFLHVQSYITFTLKSAVVLNLLVKSVCVVFIMDIFLKINHSYNMHICPLGCLHFVLGFPSMNER